MEIYVSEKLRQELDSKKKDTDMEHKNVLRSEPVVIEHRSGDSTTNIVSLFTTTCSPEQHKVDSLRHSATSRTITESQGASDVTDGLNLSEDVMSSNSQPIDQTQDINLLENITFNGYLTKALASSQHSNPPNYVIGLIKSCLTL